MKTNPVRQAINKTAFIAAAISILTLADSMLARQARPGAGARAAARAKDNELYQREMALKSLGKEPRTLSKREQLLALKEIKEDFESLQAVNNDMMRDCSEVVLLDFKLISEATTEINKRAKRLKTNLAMRLGEEDKKDEKPSVIEGEQMKASLAKLDQLIMSFVTNPLFQNPKVLDANLSSKSGDDLEQIILLSKIIKKSDEKLR